MALSLLRYEPEMKIRERHFFLVGEIRQIDLLNRPIRSVTRFAKFLESVYVPSTRLEVRKMLDLFGLLWLAANHQRAKVGPASFFMTGENINLEPYVSQA
jgi:hypothetical protein